MTCATEAGLDDIGHTMEMLSNSSLLIYVWVEQDKVDIFH